MSIRQAVLQRSPIHLRPGDPVLRTKAQTYIVDSECAAALLAASHVNRKLREGHLQKYMKQMQEGRFVWNGEPLIFDQGGRLLNGQHRLTAIVRTGVSCEMSISGGVSVEQFATMDTGAVRGGTDVLSIGGFNYRPNTLAASIRIVLFLEGGGTSRSFHAVTNNDMLNAGERLWPEIEPWTLDLRDFNQSMLPLSMAWALGVILTRSANQTLVSDFLQAISKGDGLVAGDPRLTLRERLIRDAKTKYFSGEVGKLRRLHMVARAWIAYMEGRSLSRIQLDPNELYSMPYFGSNQDKFAEQKS